MYASEMAALAGMNRYTAAQEAVERVLTRHFGSDDDACRAVAAQELRSVDAKATLDTADVLAVMPTSVQKARATAKRSVEGSEKRIAKARRVTTDAERRVAQTEDDLEHANKQLYTARVDAASVCKTDIVAYELAQQGVSRAVVEQAAAASRNTDACRVVQRTVADAVAVSTREASFASNAKKVESDTIARALPEVRTAVVERLNKASIAVATHGAQAAPELAKVPKQAAPIVERFERRAEGTVGEAAILERIKSTHHRLREVATVDKCAYLNFGRVPMWSGDSHADTKRGMRLTLCGRCDGLCPPEKPPAPPDSADGADATGDVDTTKREGVGGTVLEIKKRKNRFFYSMPQYERVQVEAYMRMYNTRDAAHVQSFGGVERIEWVEADDDFWSKVVAAAQTCVADALKCARWRGAYQAYDAANQQMRTKLPMLNIDN